MREDWLVFTTRDGTDFFRDELKVFIAHRSPGGLRVAEPMVLKLGEPIPSDVQPEPMAQATILPTELAELLLEALGHALLGSGDIVQEIHKLRNSLSKAERRIDQLIAGIGRLGGENGD